MRRAARALHAAPAYLALSLASLVALGPVLWIFVNSFKTPLEISTRPLALPDSLQWRNYVDAWVEGGLGQYFLNTLLVGAATIVIVVATAALAGFAFARLRFPGNRLLFLIFLFGITVPTPITLAPLLSLMLSLGLVDSLAALVMAYAGHFLPFAILLTRSFFRQFPREIEEAARVDGCSSLDLLWRIVLPLSLPALAVLTVFTFMNVWGEFFIALMLINSKAAKTISLGLIAFEGEYVSRQNLQLAGIVLTAIPVLLVYIIFQRGFIRGITAGSTK